MMRQLLALILLLTLASPVLAGPAPAAALARAAARAGQWDAAARLWRARTEADSRDAMAWAGLGLALLQLDAPADAAAALDRAASLGTPLAALAWPRGQAALALGDAAAARQAFAALVAARPDDPRGWTGLGIAHDLAGAHGEAQAAYGRALALDPLQAAARHNLALSRQMAQQVSGKPAAGPP